MSDDADRGGEAPCWAHFSDDLERHEPLIGIAGSNTILYSDRWRELADFYRTGVGLRVSMERDWFIEFELHAGAHVSVADADRATIASGDGRGVTLSWNVDDAGAVRHRLMRNGIDVSPIKLRWGSPGCVVFDPAGNRIEFWSRAT